MRLGAASLLRRLGDDRSAVSALEFGLCAPIFVLLMLFIMDTGLQMFEQADLDEATLVASRSLMTGSSTPTITSFDTALCNAVGGLLPCTQISFQVSTVAPTSGPTTAQFSKLTAVAPVNGFFACYESSTTNTVSCTALAAESPNVTFPGNGTQVAPAPASAYLVQAAYNRSYIAPILSAYAGTIFPTLYSTQVFLSEPWCNKTAQIPC